MLTVSDDTAMGFPLLLISDCWLLLQCVSSLGPYSIEQDFGVPNL